MPEITFAFTFSAFIAGILTFLAPCTLPLVPAYIGLISGTNEKEFEDAEEEQRKKLRKSILKNSISFIAGFSVVFILFGTLAGFFGQALVPYRIWLTRIGGILIIIFGLFMLGIIRFPTLEGDKKIKMPSWIQYGKPRSSFVVGSTFALGWTPCVGPVLGSILLLASTSTTAVTGGLMLAVFSFGLAIPFFLVAIAFAKATDFIDRISQHLKWFSRIGGIFLIAIGILLLTNNFSLLLQYGYELFDFINYEGLLDYL